MAITAQMRSDVSALYAALFNRAPEVEGFNYWCGQLEAGVSLAAMAQTMYNTTPARVTYPDGITNADVVKAFYKNVLGRDGDAEGLAFWTGKLNSGATKGQLISEMISAVNSYNGTDAAGLTSQALFQNKTSVGVTYAYTLGKTDIELAKTVLGLVTATDKTAAEIAANVGQTFTLTTGADTLVGTTGNDKFNGDKLTFASADDKFIDGSKTDADSLNLTLAAAPAGAFTVVNVESVNLEISSTSTAAVNAASFEGVQNLNVMRTNLTVGGSTITGNKQVDVTNLDASKVAKVTTGAGTTIVNVGQVTKAGVVLDANASTGAVTVTGAATVNAAESTGKVQVTALTNAQAGDAAKALVENAKNVTINAAKSVDIEVLDNTQQFTGVITINAAAATEVAVNHAAGGVTINAEKGASRITAAGAAANGIVVAGIDDSGATIVTGSYAKTTNGVDSRGQISLGGTAAATNDKASVSAAGIVALTVNAGTNQIDDVTLSGNGAAATYELTAAAGATTTKYTLTGSQDVTLEASTAALTLTTVTDTTADKTTTVKLTTVDTADLSKVAVDLIDVAATATAKVLTVATGAKVRVSADQTTSFAVAGKTADATVNLSTGDDTAASGATIDIVVGELIASTNVKALNIDATTGRLTATKLTAAATTDVVISGNKAVNLDSAGAGNAFSTAKTINAANLTAALTVATQDTATVTSGSGADKVTVNDTGSAGGAGTVAFTINTGAGADTIVVTAAKDGSLFVAGDGNDTVTLAANTAVVVDLGTGNDTVTIGDANAVLVGGDGTDKLVIGSGAGAIDLTTTTANDNFAFTGFETVDIGATNNTVTVKAAAVTGQAFTIAGAGSNDTLQVNGTATANTIDLSGIVREDANAVSLLVSAGGGNDTITGTAGADTIIGGAGSDIINGGDGLDTASWVGAAEDALELGTQAGVVVNLGATALTSATVAAAGFGVTANSVTSLAANSAAYLYAAADANNSASLDVMSGIENVTGSDGKDYIVGSANANVITGGAGVDYVAGGLGADKFVFATADIDTTAGAVTDIIGDFSAAQGDTISVGTAGSGTTYLEAGAAVADLATLLTAADTGLDGTVKIYVGQVTGGAVYAVLDTNGTGYTDVIQLTGVTLATIDATAFVV